MYDGILSRLESLSVTNFQDTMSIRQKIFWRMDFSLKIGCLMLVRLYRRFA